MSYGLAPAAGGNLPAGLSFDGMTRVLSGAPTAIQAAAEYTYTVTDGDAADPATDATPDTATLTFTITISDFMPVFAGDSDIDDQTYLMGVAIADLTLPQATGGDGTLRYALAPAAGGNLPDGLSFDRMTRVLSGVPATVQVAAAYTYTATDADAVNPDTATLTFMITIRGPDTKPVFTDFPARIPVLTYPVGLPITPLTLPEATGGNAPLRYTFTLFTTGPLSDGLSFDSDTRVLSGTPTTVNPTVRGVVRNTRHHYIAIDVDDDESFFLPYDIVIVENAPTFAGASIPNQTYPVGVATELTLPAATRGDGTLSYTLAPSGGQGLSGLPDGLSFDGMTRILSGAPTTIQAAAAYTYTATDADVTDPDSDTLTFMITIVRNAPTFGDTPAFTLTYDLDEVVNVTLPEATGGNGDLTYGVFGLGAGGNLIAFGLALDDETRVISGTVRNTVGIMNNLFEIRVNDADSDRGAADQARLRFTLVIIPESEPAFAAGLRIPDPTWPVGLAIAELTLPEVTGGNAPLRYTLAPSAGQGLSGLPAGLSFDGMTRILSGAPATVQAAAEYTYTVTDGDLINPDSVSLRFMITIVENAPAFAVAGIPAQTYYRGEVVNFTLPVAGGGDGALNYDLILLSGANNIAELGLAFNNTTLVLSGAVPNNAPLGPTTFTYRVNDADPNTDEADRADLPFTVTIIVTPPAAGVITSTNPDPLVENTLDGATLEVTLAFTTYVDPLTTSNFVLTHAQIFPGVLTLASVRRDSPTQATLTMAYDGHDFDQNALINLRVLPSAHTRTGDIFITNTPVTAIFESSNATLAGLALSGGAVLAPAFDSGTFVYTADVINSVAEIMVTPTAADDGATIAVNGDAVDSGTPGAAIALTAGEATGIDVLVTAEDGAATRTYTLAVTRAGSPTAIISAPASLHENDADGAVLTITLANTVYTDPLPDAAFTLALGGTASGITVASSTRTDATTATLTLAYADVSGITGDTTIAVTVAAAAHTEDGDLTTGTVAVTADAAPGFDGFGVGESIADMIYTLAVPITLTLPEATGGDGTLRYTLAPSAGGNLPAGLTFDGMPRVLSGTPTATRTAAEYTYTATDSDATNPDSVSLRFMITIIPVPGPDTNGPPVFEISRQPLIVYVVGAHASSPPVAVRHRRRRHAGVLL